MVCKNCDDPAGADPAAKKEKLAEAERQIHERKLEAQRLADCVNINADLVKNDMEESRQADAQKFRDIHQEMAAEAQALQGRVQEAESKADVASTGRGKSMAEQIGMAKKTTEENAALCQGVEHLKDMVKALHAALTSKADPGVGF